jgi:hypothetical protein
MEMPMAVELPDGYKPKLKEEYMNPLQLEYFRQKLTAWREELMQEAQETLENLRALSVSTVMYVLRCPNRPRT